MVAGLRAPPRAPARAVARTNTRAKMLPGDSKSVFRAPNSVSAGSDFVTTPRKKAHKAARRRGYAAFPRRARSGSPGHASICRPLRPRHHRTPSHTTMQLRQSGRTELRAGGARRGQHLSNCSSALRAGRPFNEETTYHTEYEWSDDVLDMPTKELNAYARDLRLSRAEVADLKLARRRRKNRTYAKEARKRRRQRKGQRKTGAWEASTAASSVDSVSEAGECLVPGGLEHDNDDPLLWALDDLAALTPPEHYAPEHYAPEHYAPEQHHHVAAPASQPLCLLPELQPTLAPPSLQPTLAPPSLQPSLAQLPPLSAAQAPLQVPQWPLPPPVADADKLPLDPWVTLDDLNALGLLKPEQPSPVGSLPF